MADAERPRDRSLRQSARARRLRSRSRTDGRPRKTSGEICRAEASSTEVQTPSVDGLPCRALPCYRPRAGVGADGPQLAMAGFGRYPQECQRLRRRTLLVGSGRPRVRAGPADWLVPELVPPANVSAAPDELSAATSARTRPDEHAPGRGSPQEGCKFGIQTRSCAPSGMSTSSAGLSSFRSSSLDPLFVSIHLFGVVISRDSGFSRYREIIRVAAATSSIPS